MPCSESIKKKVYWLCILGENGFFPYIMNRNNFLRSRVVQHSIVCALYIHHFNL